MKMTFQPKKRSRAKVHKKSNKIKCFRHFQNKPHSIVETSGLRKVIHFLWITCG